MFPIRAFFSFQFPLTLHCSTLHTTLVPRHNIFSHLAGQLSQTLSYLTELTERDHIDANELIWVLSRCKVSGYHLDTLGRNWVHCD